MRALTRCLGLVGLMVAPGLAAAAPAVAGETAPAPAAAPAGPDAAAAAKAMSPGTGPMGQAGQAAAADPGPADADPDALPLPGGEPEALADDAVVDEPPPTAAADAPVTVTTRLSPNPSSIGDLLTLEVTAAFPVGVRVNLPMGLDFAPLHLVSIDEGEPESTGQGLRKVFTITLQHFQVGEARVPGFPMTWVGADGQVQTLKVPATPFTVDALLANEADPKRQEEDPPISLEYPAERAELVIYSAAVAMVLGFLLALLWRRLRRRPALVVGPPPIPAHERALTALDALEGAGLLETGLYQDYYVELTEIAKGYLEGRFGVDALDRTTDELRRELVRAGDKIQPLSPDEVIRFLQDCDLVKFARFAPEVDEARGALGKVRTMVEETKPVPRDTPKETGASGQDGKASPGAAAGAAAPSAGSAEATPSTTRSPASAGAPAPAGPAMGEGIGVARAPEASAAGTRESAPPPPAAPRGAGPAGETPKPEETER